MKITVNSIPAKNLLREYAKLAQQDIETAVKDEGRFLAQRLVALTPPKTAAQGKKRVSIDTAKVYLAAQWFSEIFNFTSQSFGDRVKELITSKDGGILSRIFQNTDKLKKIIIEPFNKSIIRRFRKHGRVSKNVTPHSLPLNDSAKRKQYEDAQKKKVGLVKSGWASALRDLGGSAPGWLNRSGTGKAIISPPGEKVSVTLVNNVSYAADLERKGIVRTAVAGRQKDLAGKIKSLLSRNNR